MQYKKLLENKADINPFCTYLEELLNPLDRELKSKIEQATSSLANAGAITTFDQKFECSDFQMTMKINSEANIKNLINGLERFDYQEYLKIWNGNVR